MTSEPQSAVGREEMSALNAPSWYSASEADAWASGYNKAIDALRPSASAGDALGFWMSAALDDPAVCDAMKADIRAWFEAACPVPSASAGGDYARGIEDAAYAVHNNWAEIKGSCTHICATIRALALTPSAPSGDGGRWRPKVAAFADLMEQQLRANDHKPGWLNDTARDLLSRLRDETVELAAEVERWLSHLSNNVGKEAADVANFAMMVADLCGDLRTPPTAAPAGDAIERAALYVLENSRRSNVGLSDEQRAADTDKLMEAYRDIIRKALASGALAAPSGDDAGLREAAVKLRDHFRTYPTGYLTRLDLNDLFAALSASPAPKSGDR